MYGGTHLFVSAHSFWDRDINSLTQLQFTWRIAAVFLTVVSSRRSKGQWKCDAMQLLPNSLKEKNRATRYLNTAYNCFASLITSVWISRKPHDLWEKCMLHFYLWLCVETFLFLPTNIHRITLKNLAETLNVKFQLFLSDFNQYQQTLVINSPISNLIKIHSTVLELPHSKRTDVRMTVAELVQLFVANPPNQSPCKILRGNQLVISPL
jgi:hypothetical protein